MKDNRDIAIAKRIIDLDIFSARDNELTPEKLAEWLNDAETCKTAIDFLLDIIDDLQG